MNKKYLRKEDIKSGMLVEYCGELCLVVQAVCAFVE